ncbi:MAG: translation initiation factor IF-2 [Acidimicrobiia bacterium]|nr:translation initiation factor IF-2 [Acidimicrobiia bacterium]
MAAKIRVYELARELGLSNAETLELCDALGIGAKSHSSSIVDAQADRVRRKAEREGLIREVQPEEEKPVEAKPAKKKAAVSTKKPPPKKKKAAEPAPEPVAEAEPEPVVEAPAPVAEEPAPVVEEPVAAEEPAVADPVVAEGGVDPDQELPKGIVSSKDSRPRVSEGPVPPPPTATPKPAPQPKAEGDSPAPDAPAAPPSIGSDPKKDAPKPPGPMSGTGRPIPPPPGPPRSQSGKPIPPPPGRPGGPRTAPAAGAGANRSGGYGGGPPRSGGGGPARPGGGPRPVPGAGAPPAGGGGGRPGGGRPGGPAGRRPPKRKGRRRRNREELQPMNVPSYSSDDAPVPTGQVVIERAITPLDLGPKFNRTAADVVRFMMQQGEMVTATQSLSDELITAFAEDLDADVKLVDPGEEQEVELRKMLGLDDDDDDDEEFDDDAPIRPPVITVMGHVDHGKTKLLDNIRQAKVADDEAGGITQHIGAYQTVRNGQALTFIDTPGHEAFTAMRSRGAKATDIVILVVAADDGMMPQTIEALNHAKAANVPIVVAINKIDRENANVNRVMTQLSENDLIPESFGGDTIVQEISALKSIGIEELLDQLLVVAELEDLRADPNDKAQGVVLESNLDIGRGPVATVLVQEGTLRVGDPMVAGAAWGRVRALINDKGENVKEAGPSTPVQVLGLSDVADAGGDFNIAPSEKVASKVADTREHWHRQTSLGRDSSATSGGARLEDIFEQIQRGEAANLNLIIKADVNGSLEAVTDSLRKLETPEVKPTFVHRGVGGITENDIALAAASNATIIGFNVRPDRKARTTADSEGVEIRTYEIIYKLLEDVESAMVGLLAPEFEEIVTGDAEVREIFSVPKIGRIAGCYVTNGVITRNSKVRFIRDGTIIWKGEVKSLRRFKDDAREVAAGYECGIGLSDFQDLKDGDIIETYEEREIERSIS